jgi:hypothetical protein
MESNVLEISITNETACLLVSNVSKKCTLAIAKEAAENAFGKM